MGQQRQVSKPLAAGVLKACWVVVVALRAARASPAAGQELTPPICACWSVVRRLGGPQDQVLGCSFARYKIPEVLLPVAAGDDSGRYQDLLLRAAAGRPLAGAGR